jgi:hypothetical protein
MEFIKKLVEELGLGTKAELARRLGKSLQGLYSLELAGSKLSLRDIVALRRLPGMTDEHLLDLIEAEARLGRPSGRVARKGNPVGRPPKRKI